MSKNARSGDIGGVLAAAGAFVVAIGAPLPWERLTFGPSPVRAVITTFVVESCGVLLGLAAVPLCLPGPVRQRAPLLAATVLLCVIGVILARPGSTHEIVVF